MLNKEAIKRDIEKVLLLNNNKVNAHPTVNTRIC